MPKISTRKSKSVKKSIKKSSRTRKSAKSVKSRSRNTVKSRSRKTVKKSVKSRSRKTVKKSIKPRSRKSVKKSVKLRSRKSVKKSVKSTNVKSIQPLSLTSSLKKEHIPHFPYTYKRTFNTVNEFMFSHMKHWVMNTFTYQSRLEWFKNVMSIYNFSFFDKKYRSQQLIDMVLRNDQMYDLMKSTAVWVAYSSDQSEEKKIEIAKTLLFRYPVYFGKYREDWINVDKANTVFPYLPEMKQMNIEPSTIYTLGSLIPSYINNKDPNYKWIGMLHTWGINFESKDTYDYHRYHDENGQIIFSLYETGVKEMLYTVVKALETLVEKTYKISNKYKRVHLRVPAIGLGAYLEAVSSEKDKETCRSIFKKSLQEIMSSFKSPLPVDVLLCQREKLIQFSDSIKDCDNLFELSDDPTVLDVIVNAWDSYSFVGNGGANDPTIDGFVGSGLNGYIECAAYAQNIFFLPQLAYQLNVVNM
jgi:hypothetical protein